MDREEHLKSIAWGRIARANEALETERFVAAELYSEAAEKFREAQYFELAGLYYKKAGDTYAVLKEKMHKGEKWQWDEEGALNIEERVLGHAPDIAFRDVLRDIHISYHKSRMAFQAGSFHIQARESYIREMDIYRELIRQEYKIEADSSSYEQTAVTPIVTPVKLRVVLCVLKWLCNYGERPSWLILWAILLIGMFTIAYYPNPWGSGFIELRGVEWSSEKFSFHDLVAACYFSMVTFTTLGYGDVYPTNTWARIFTCAEAAIGYAMLGVFVAVMARKLFYT
jgi:hypothetical protein